MATLIQPDGEVTIVQPRNGSDFQLDELREFIGGGWIEIVGGESGPGYREMDHAWARDLRDRCVDAGVAYFFKQSSGYRTEMGQLLDGERWEQRPALQRERALL